MAKRVQRFRVDGTSMSTLTGLEGEIIVNLTNFSLHVHDGVTQGGFALSLADASNMQEANASQDGKMTGARIVELETATSGVATNAANIATNTTEIAANDTDISDLQSDKADKIVPSAVGNVATLSASGNLQDGGLLVTDVGLEATTIATFNQTTAPTGWTKLLVDDNKAFRVVTGTVGTGGGDGFSTVFGSGKSTVGHVLTVAQMPAHGHSARVSSPGGVHIRFAFADGTIAPATNTDDILNTGGGGSHSHNISNLDLQFVDMILAQKD